MREAFLKQFVFELILISFSYWLLMYDKFRDNEMLSQNSIYELKENYSRI